MNRVNCKTNSFIILTLIFLFNFCAEKKPSEPTELPKETTLLKSVNTNPNANLSVTSDSVKTKDKKKGGDIHPDAVSQCQKVVNYWIFEKYENVTGKIVGILPTTERFNNNNRLAELKNKWGFNFILTTDVNYDKVTTAGFSSSNIMLYISPGDGVWENVIANSPISWGYFTDEFVSRLLASNPFLTDDEIRIQANYVRNAIKNKSQTAKYIDGETTVGFANVIDDIVDDLLCTKYDRLPWSTDQRPLWTDFRNNFLTKFSMTWVAAHKDLSEYDNLLGHALNIGLNGVWLYQQEDSTDSYSDNNISSFSLFAWKWGWLSKVERKWTYVYECIHQNPCDCDPYTLGAEWILVEKYPTYETRTVAY